MSNATSSTVKALETFFGDFGIPVYPEDSVPDGAEVPYITVQLIAPHWRANGTPFYARVWYRGYNYDAINAKVDQIRDAIGEGASVPTEGGAVYIWAEDNFCQYQPYAGDPTLKCAYLSMSLQSINP